MNLVPHVVVPLVLTFLPALAAAADQPAWWEKEPLRIIDVITSFDQSAREWTPAQWAERKAALGYNAEHLDVMKLARGLDDTGWLFRSKLASTLESDFLRAYLPEAKKRGIRVMIYFDVHWYTREFGQKHAEWLQMKESGKPVNDVYVTGTDFCVNSPWREWVFQVLRDLAAYPIDGIFFDGPIFFPESCYCEHCQAKYRKLHNGASLPSKKVRIGAGARDLLVFQADSLADFLHDSRAVLKSVNPDLMLYMNGGERGGNWATGRLNRVLVKEQDILGSEGGFIGSDLLQVPVWKPSVTARLLESQAGGKPRVIFSAAQHKPWTFSILPRAELRLLYAGTIANAANVWFGMWPSELRLPEMDAITEMNQFVQRNGAFYTGTRSEAKVALVWSDTTANYYQGSDAQLIEMDRVPRRSDVGNLNGEFAGFAEALIRSHIPFDVVDDATLEKEDLSRYQAIILPNVACMSAVTAARLDRFAKDGGGLLATFETSLYDDTGVRRPNFALASVFGASIGGRIVGPKRWDFLKATAGNEDELLFRGAAREFVPSPVYHIQVKADSDARTVARFTKPLTGVYDGIPVLSDDPALVVHSVGKGRVIYFPADLGNGMNTYRLSEFLHLIGNSVRSLAPPRVTLENAPASVEVVLRSQQNPQRLLLHLVNFTGEMTRPIERILPLKDVRITLADARNVKRVHTLAGGKDLEFRASGSGIAFTLPAMEDYEVVVVE
jgi:hypothetical protein